MASHSWLKLLLSTFVFAADFLMAKTAPKTRPTPSFELVQEGNTDADRHWTIKRLPSELSFDEGFFLSVRAIQTLVSKNQRVIVVGIAGPSGAGKTSLALRISEVLRGTTYVQLPFLLARVHVDPEFCPWITIWIRRARSSTTILMILDCLISSCL